MPWVNEKRYRRAKTVEHDTEPGRKRITSSLDVMHYEGVIDSGDYDTEVDLRPVRTNNNLLNGWRINTNGWRFAYQGFAATQNQPEIGTLGYGGRRGSNWFTMRPARIGFLRWGNRNFQSVGGSPNFSTPSVENLSKQIGNNDSDPWVSTLNSGFRATIANLWTAPGGGSVDWVIKGTGGQLKQDFVINQVARDALAAQFNNGPASQNWFGIAYRVDWLDIPSRRMNGQEVNPDDDIEPTNNLEMRDAAGRLLGKFQNGEIYVRGRGGRVPIRKRFYFDGTDWWLFIGARVTDMNQNLLDGDLVIDPPISEESVTSNDDDAWQGYPTAGNVYLQYSDMIYWGTSPADTDYWSAGFRFRSVPIGNAATVNSATCDPMQNQATGGAESGNIQMEDEDDALIFTTGASNITNRTLTTASVAFTDADYQGNGSRTQFDVSGPLQEVINRTGWPDDDTGNLAVIFTSTNNNYEFTGWDSYTGGVGNACDFNADVTEAGGGSGRIMSSLAFEGGLAGTGGIAGAGGGLAG